MMRLNYGLMLIGLLLLTACAGPQKVVQAPQVSTPLNVTVNKGQNLPENGSVISTARKMLGIPYRYGGASPNGFDCSDLGSYVYRSAGIQVPRTSKEQYRQADRIPLAQLQPGDLLFFRLQPQKVSHVAIYEGRGRFIHAPSSGKRVSYASLDNPYWRKHLVGAGRF